ncbi:hypothetical protein [Tunturiibacter psychrotolerans]|jgi:hypothetical protein|uniref:hypothetical protein n=1 Tax=Tunturiibacter psychrotolerans TaxID=3069686 RepID=UPI003D1DBF8B
MVLNMRFAVLAAAVLLAGTGPAVKAQQPAGPHPAYQHALSDLRAARRYLNEGMPASVPVKRDADAATMHIDAAVADIKQASIEEDKTLHDSYRFDPNLSPKDRFDKANQLLLSAHKDLENAEDLPQAAQLRNRAIHDIDYAHTIVDNAQKAGHWQ